MVGRKFVKMMVMQPNHLGKNWVEIAIPLEDIIKVKIAQYNDTENIVYITVKKNNEEFKEIVCNEISESQEWLKRSIFEV